VSYNSDFRERQAASSKAKATLLAKFRAAPGQNDRERKARDEARVRIVEARQARAAAREAARMEREKALAEESAREAERRATEERAARNLRSAGRARICRSLVPHARQSLQFSQTQGIRQEANVI